MLTINEVKKYLRLEEDFTEEDALLESLVLSAKIYVESALGQKLDDKSPENVKLIVLLLVSHWYENRGTQTNSKSLNSDISFTVRALLDQLMWGEYYEGTEA